MCVAKRNSAVVDSSSSPLSCCLVNCLGWMQSSPLDIVNMDRMRSLHWLWLPCKICCQTFSLGDVRKLYFLHKQWVWLRGIWWEGVWLLAMIRVQKTLICLARMPRDASRCGSLTECAPWRRHLRCETGAAELTTRSRSRCGSDGCRRSRCRPWRIEAEGTQP